MNYRKHQATDQTDYYEMIEAWVEIYRGGRDVPGFDACVRAEINKRFAELYANHKNWEEITGND